jgi:hypothetical protein
MITATTVRSSPETHDACRMIDFMPYAIISGPAPGQVLAGLASGEMWESHDHGDNWTKLDLRMPSIERCLVRLQV